MPTSLSRIRLGAGALFAASLVGGLCPLIRHMSETPLFTGENWMPVISPQLIGAVLLGTGASLLQALSAWGLYSHLQEGQAERPVLLSLICSVVGSWFVLPLLGVLALGVPTTSTLANSVTPNGMDIAVSTMGIPFLLFAGLSGVAASLGALFLSVGLGRLFRYPRWALWLYTVSVPVEDFTPAIPVLVEVGAVVLFLLAGGTLLVALWREPGRTQESALLQETS